MRFLGANEAIWFIPSPFSDEIASFLAMTREKVLLLCIKFSTCYGMRLLESAYPGVPGVFVYSNVSITSTITISPIRARARNRSS